MISLDVGMCQKITHEYIHELKTWAYGNIAEFCLLGFGYSLLTKSAMEKLSFWHAL